jgi:hypothetical protein
MVRHTELSTCFHACINSIHAKSAQRMLLGSHAALIVGGLLVVLMHREADLQNRLAEGCICHGAMGIAKAGGGPNMHVPCAGPDNACCCACAASVE